MQEADEGERQVDDAAVEERPRGAEVELGHVQDVVEGAVEDVAEGQPATLEGAHRVLGDRDEEEAARNPEDDLDLVEEAAGGLVVHLVELVDADQHAALARDDLEELLEQADDVGQAELFLGELSAAGRTGLKPSRELERPRPAGGEALLEPDLAQPQGGGGLGLVVVFLPPSKSSSKPEHGARARRGGRRAPAAQPPGPRSGRGPPSRAWQTGGG